MLRDLQKLLALPATQTLAPEAMQTVVRGLVRVVDRARVILPPRAPQPHLPHPQQLAVQRTLPRRPNPSLPKAHAFL